MLETLVTVLVVLVIAGGIIWLADQLPPPFPVPVKVITGLIAVIILLYMLLRVGGIH
jgi:hypothetical protein